MNYMFRARFKVAPTIRIDANIEELVLDKTGDVRVCLKSLTPGQLVKDAEELALRGEGYSSEAQAADDGKRWVGALVLGTISEFVGIDFGQRDPMGWLSPTGLELASAMTPGARAYNDDPGLMVVPQSPPPVFHRNQATAIAGKNGAALAGNVRHAFIQRAEPDAQSLLACEMYGASQLMPSGDSRFLMLMIAVEAMIEAGNRSTAQVQAIDQLIERLDSLPFGEDDRRVLKQTIGGLKRESINSAGKRLAASLGDRTYAGKSPKAFFADCYTARSNLVHGNLGRPDSATIRELTGHLERFVRDLVLMHNGLF